MKSLDKVYCATAIAAKDDYILIKNIGPMQSGVKSIKFINFLKKGAFYHENSELFLDCAVILNNDFGLADNCKCLLACQEKIPKQVLYNYIVLPNTIIRYAPALIRVSYLYWTDIEWAESCLWFYDGITDVDSLVYKE